MKAIERTVRTDFRVIGLMILVGVTAIVTRFTDDLVNLSLEQTCRVACLVLVLSFTLILSVARNGMYSVPVVYAGVFTIFHFALLVAFAVDTDAVFAAYPSLQRWTEFYYMNYAVVLVSLGLLTFSTGVLLASLQGRRQQAAALRASHDYRGTFAWLGFCLVVVSVFSWFWRVFTSGGFNLLVTSYLDFLEKTSDSSPAFGLIYLGLGLGLVFLAASRNCFVTRAGLSIFILFALIALPLGLRGEVLFPAFAGLAVAGMRCKRISLFRAFLIFIVLLTAISVIRQVRDVGLAQLDVSDVRLSPVDTLVELGSSIRPVVVVLTWEDNDEEPILGSSYLAPIDRLLVYFVPGWSRPLAAEDDRLLNVLVQRRVGPIGFSPVAEAYRNFGLPGVMLFMFLVGYLFGRMDLWSPTPIRQVIVGIVMLPLLLQVRNAFIQVPFQLATGCLLLVFALVVTNKLSDPSEEILEASGQV